MKSIFYILLMLVLTYTSCTKQKAYCGTKHPESELGWLKERIKNQPDYYDIYKLNYNGTEGFYFVLRQVCAVTFLQKVIPVVMALCYIRPVALQDTIPFQRILAMQGRS